MWYCASILWVAERNGVQDSDSLWEEQLVLIEAGSEESARAEGLRRASQPRAAYKNNDGVTISWRFVKIDRIYEIGNEQLTNGTEIFSRFLRDSEARSLMTPFSDEKC